jgi:hypothetical protein
MFAFISIGGNNLFTDSTPHISARPLSKYPPYPTTSALLFRINKKHITTTPIAVPLNIPNANPATAPALILSGGGGGVHPALPAPIPVAETELPPAVVACGSRKYPTATNRDEYLFGASTILPPIIENWFPVNIALHIELLLALNFYRFMVR